MRPRDLTFPSFMKERRAPLFHEGIFFIPREMDQSVGSPLDLLPTGLPIHIEYCSGNGEWIVNQASQDPSVYWIGVERQFDRVRKIWSKKRNLNLSNLLIVCGEAKIFTEHYLPRSSIRQVFINFPDPWPKRKHAEHRLIQFPFVDILAKTIKKGGKIVCVTDHSSYANQIIDTLNCHQNLVPSLPSPYYALDWPDYGSSWFHHLSMKKGCPVHYIPFEKQCD